MIEWTEQDAVPLRQYLATSSGQRLVSLLRQSRPSLGGTTIEQAAMNAKVAEGAEGITDFILLLSEHTRSKNASRPFVSVRDEAARAAAYQT